MVLARRGHSARERRAAGSPARSTASGGRAEAALERGTPERVGGAPARLRPRPGRPDPRAGARRLPPVRPGPRARRQRPERDAARAPRGPDPGVCWACRCARGCLRARGADRVYVPVAGAGAVDPARRRDGRRGAGRGARRPAAVALVRAAPRRRRHAGAQPARHRRRRLAAQLRRGRGICWCSRGRSRAAARRRHGAAGPARGASSPRGRR